MKTVVFCDFDGTISRRDVGYSLFHHFSGGENEKLLPDWKAGRMSSRECLSREAAMVHAPAEEILSFLDQFEIDPGFPEFELLCRRRGVPIIILSDGLDLYIKRILSRYHLDHLPVTCNIAKLNSHGLEIEFPRTNRACTRCGSCKGEIIEEYVSQDSGEIRTVFIGDGYSDTCATRAADFLFAKKDLERYCLDHGIAYNRFDTFFDVARLLVENGYLKA
jgi:2-hydroxy-3-keto-5-methylthiopentenyl-1-phosphate phosphatase